MREGETNRCNLDARRCYSMGTFQYVVDNSNLQVALSDGTMVVVLVMEVVMLM